MPITYISVAGFCILLHNAIMIIGDKLGLSLGLAVLISFGMVASSGYVLHGLFTFRQPLNLLGFGRYAFAMSANIPLAFITTWFWHEALRLPMYLAAPLASLCMLALNFILGRWAIAAPNHRPIARQ